MNKSYLFALIIVALAFILIEAISLQQLSPWISWFIEISTLLILAFGLYKNSEESGVDDSHLPNTKQRSVDDFIQQLANNIESESREIASEINRTTGFVNDATLTLSSSFQQ